MPPKTIAQGAEAKIILIKEGKNNFIIKDRISKSYRIPELDKRIIKSRTKKEANILEKAHKLINSPNPKILDFNKIQMPFIEGKKLSEFLEKLNYKQICKQIAKNISILHNNNIIHGDLTTSNMIYVETNDKLGNKDKLSSKTSNQETPRPQKFNTLTTLKRGDNKNNFQIIFIDFGLGFISNKIEDKAVDLHLIKQALEAKHFSIWKECWSIIEKNYNPNEKEAEKILEQLKKVELRGRYKH